MTAVTLIQPRGVAGLFHRDLEAADPEVFAG